MGERILTLRSLLRPGLRAVVVGINPSPVSVAAGHYYQGTLGRRLWARLRDARVLPGGEGVEDDRAYAAGIGFTDAVKRPTPRGHHLRPGELAHGRGLLEAELAAAAAPKVIFAFKTAADALLGKFDGHGLLEGRTFAGAEIFVMPGPMERKDHADRSLRQLVDWWRS